MSLLVIDIDIVDESYVIECFPYSGRYFIQNTYLLRWLPKYIIPNFSLLRPLAYPKISYPILDMYQIGKKNLESSTHAEFAKHVSSKVDPWRATLDARLTSYYTDP